ncbi:palmitoyl-monogalactosyldiacylglycerol delta-7 desaturase, chloroplastic-like protein [Tanacetum coccineum]
MGRKWRTVDVKMAVGMLAIHVLALFAPFTFTWGAFWAAFWSYALCGICGVTLSYHRNLAHHSLKLPKWLEYTFAYLGVLAIQRDPIYWRLHPRKGTAAIALHVHMLQRIVHSG